MEQQETTDINIQPADKAKIAKIWKVAAYLTIITALEFVIAFTVDAGTFKTITFIIMTLIKAGYIVGEFMHLSHEAKGLIYSILMPCVFVLWLILALIMQGAAIFEILAF